MESNTRARTAFENFTNATHNQLNLNWPLFTQEQYRNMYSRNQWQQQVGNAFDKEIANFGANNATQICAQENSGILQEYLLLMQQQKINQEQFWLNKQQELQRRALQSAACSMQYPLYSPEYKENLNDISKSLRMFSTYTANNELNLNTNNDNLDAIMKDFAVNGYTKDADAESHDRENTSEYTNDSFKRLNTNLDGRNWLTYNNNMQLPSQLQQKQYANNQMFQHINSRSKSKRSQSNKKQKKMASHCVFCENNNEPEAVVKSHAVRDGLGRVLCPKLRIYVCPICKASGDEAHTVKYCPKKPIITMEIAAKQKFIT